jgi:polysaccharide biosynthesis/export protein
MKTKLFSRQVLVLLLAALIMGMSSCSVKPHNRQSGSDRSKAIVDLQNPESGEAKTTKSNKRTRTTASSRRSRDKKKTSDPKKAETPNEVINLANNSTETAAPQAVNAPETSQPTQHEEKPQASQTVVQLSESVKDAPRLYRLGYGDVVSIKFFQTPEYNETVTVRPDGFITLQQVGDLYVAGKTTEEIDQKVTEVFSEVLQNPQVTVFVRQFGGQQCYVMGEVERPGVIALAKGMTLMRAIAAAGGPKKTAKMSSIILIRSEDLKKAEASRLDLSLGYLAKHMETDLSVQAYDVVYVPKTFIADVGAFMTQIYDIVLPPFDAWARYEFWYKN